MNRRSLLETAAGLLCLYAAGPARAHHGWNGFDQGRPLYLEGKAATVRWRNPHVEIELERQPGAALPPDLAQRALPAQSAAVDGPGLLARATLPTRKDSRWIVELAPLTRMAAWQVPEITAGQTLAVLGYTHAGEQGDAVLRAEYLFLGSKAYGLRSSPA